MMTGWIVLLAQAALRALVAAVAVGGALRLLRVTNVVAEKLAWALILVAALALPLLPAEFRVPDALLARASHVAEHAWSDARHWAERQMTEYWPEGWQDRRRAAASTPATSAGRAARPIDPGVASATVAGSVQNATEPEAEYALETPDLDAPAVEGTPAAQSLTIAARLAAQEKLPHWPAWATWAALGLYLVVAAALVFRLAVGLAAALRLWLKSRPVACEAAEGLRVRASERIASPVTVGSAVLLPAAYLGWAPEKLRVVLAHEQSHVRQGDFYLQLAAGIYTALVWPSPLGWWLRHRLSELGEAISDRAGLEAAASRTSYAQLLLEIAAMPRPTGLGVAMAQPSRLSHRIEHLLNEASFTKAFTASRRALVAVLVAPLALLTSAALVQVHAAVPEQELAPLAQQPATQTAVELQAAPAPAPVPSPALAAEPDAAPAPAPQSEAATPPAPAAPPQSAMPPAPPAPPEALGPEGLGPVTVDIDPNLAQKRAKVHVHPQFSMNTNGEPYALFREERPDDRQHLNGFTPEQVEKARKMAHGHFLLFRHEGKVYLIDDPATVAQLEASQANATLFAKKMGELGRAEGEKGRQVAEQVRQMRVNLQVKVPDLSNEMAEVSKALAELKAKQGSSISTQEFGQLERQLGELQRKLNQAQFKGLEHMDLHLDDTATRQMGEEMRTMGEQMGKAFRLHNEQVRATIDESLKSGKARQVE